MYATYDHHFYTETTLNLSNSKYISFTTLLEAHAHRDISYKILTIQAITTHLILLQITAFVEQGRNYSVQENLGLWCILYIHYIYRKCNAGHYTIS